MSFSIFGDVNLDGVLGQCPKPPSVFLHILIGFFIPPLLCLLFWLGRLVLARLRYGPPSPRTVTLQAVSLALLVLVWATEVEASRGKPKQKSNKPKGAEKTSKTLKKYVKKFGAMALGLGTQAGVFLGLDKLSETLTGSDESTGLIFFMLLGTIIFAIILAIIGFCISQRRKSQEHGSQVSQMIMLNEAVKGLVRTEPHSTAGTNPTPAEAATVQCHQGHTGRPLF